MSSPALRLALFMGLLVAALPVAAQGEPTSGWQKTALTLEAPVALPLGAPLSDRFGMGTMPSLSVSWSAGRMLMLGARLRLGFLSDGPAPSDPSLRDPGTGGLGTLSFVARLRPWAKHAPESRLLGPWIEVGTGPGLTGDLLRVTAEAAVGWNFRMLGVVAGPVARYLHVFQPADEIDGADAQIALLGVEIGLHDARVPVTEQAAPPPAPVTAVEVVKLTDRDGDGIPDDADKCPNEPEDKDGFEDSDGCPDPDNDKDGLADVADACPNEPETVNGFQDEDGCPDQAEIVVKENRILLTQHVLFDTNRARVNPDGWPALAAVFNLWQQHPEWDHLTIDGYADRRGPDGYNYWLSRQRAERVARVLVSMGFPIEKLRMRAFGHRQLRVAGDDEEADRQNRRVEFVIVKKGEAPAAGDESLQPPTPAEAGAIEP
jgi:outer membrane protein OmpA-like peptidoglycan-associated protein